MEGLAQITLILSASKIFFPRMASNFIITIKSIPPTRNSLDDEYGNWDTFPAMSALRRGKHTQILLTFFADSHSVAGGLYQPFQ
jgi:hypothetical protein